jgi:hypothetical protein
MFNKSLIENVGNSVSGECIVDFVQYADEVKRSVEIIIRNSEKQKEFNVLSKSQQILYELMITLSADLKGSFIHYKGERLSLWNIPKEIRPTTIDQFEFNDVENTKRTSETCKRIIGMLEDITKPSNIIKIIRYFFTDSTLGSLDYVSTVNIYRLE